MPGDYDAKKYICPPWIGKRGPPFLRRFKPAFENALKLQHDNFSTFYQHLYGQDFGGWAVNAPVHIAGAGALAAQNALSVAAYRTRGDSIRALLKTHILNEDITDAMDTYGNITLVGAAPRPVGAVPPGPGGAAVAGQLPVDWPLQLWIHIEQTSG